MRIIYLIFLLFFSQNAISAELDNKQLQVRNSLLNLSDEELIKVRALNNYYSKYCKNHIKKNVMKRLSEVVAQVVVIDKPHITNTKNHFKYGFYKGQIISFKNKKGTANFCNCIYNYFIVGDTSCFR